MRHLALLVWCAAACAHVPQHAGSAPSPAGQLAAGAASPSTTPCALPSSEPGLWPASMPPAARAVLDRLAADNAQFAARHPETYFEEFRDAQRPAVTLVACSDARFQEDDLDAAPDGQIFTVRNIGNQLDLNEGSVEYGVRHLHTPVLLIVGHVHCGAVRAALDDYGAASAALRRELNGLHLSLRRTPPDRPLAERWLSGVFANVDQQVRDAVQLFAPEVKAGALTVVGAVYDFRDDLHRGAGRLVWTNVNGRAWPPAGKAPPP